jgi:hypothetical protein
MAILILFVLSNTGIAQYVNDFKRTADAFFEKGDFYSASQYYDRYLNSRQTKISAVNYKPYMLQITSKSGKKELNTYETVVYKLAESYRRYNDYANAERYYAIAAGFDTAAYPLSRYWYGVSLRANTKYADAEMQFNQFLQGYKMNDEYTDNARRELANCQFIQKQLAARQSTVAVRKMSSYINQGGATYAPVWLNNTTFLFTSSRADSVMIVKSKGKNPYFNNLYQARFIDTAYTRPEKVEVAVSGDLQQGVASFTPGEKKMFLTRWEHKEGKNIGAIYVSEKNAGSWGTPVKLNGNINIEGYSSIQPFVTSDGKYLVFSSDRPGGVGKYDLWYCTLDATLMPGSANNMGTTINTRDDEQGPYYHVPSATFVFASNGRVGMGGYDLYKTNGDFRNWGEVKNMGYPMNSTKDDIYFFSKGKKYMLSDMYFSSDRNSVCCLEMYDAKKANLYITGKVVDCATKEPMVGAKISVVDTILNKVIYTQQLDATGSYGFELEDFQPLKLVAEKQYYYPRSFHFFKPQLPDADTLFNPVLCLPHEDTAKPYPVGKPVVMKDIYYDFDKATLRPESYPVLDTLAKVLRMYPKMEIEIGSHTDSKGTNAYNLKLSAARAKSCVDYLVKVGIEPFRMYSKGFGESTPVAPNTTPNGKDNPDGRALNRRTEVKVLHY